MKVEVVTGPGHKIPTYPVKLVPVSPGDQFDGFSPALLGALSDDVSPACVNLGLGGLDRVRVRG